jgi:hypothetical protein
MLNKVRIITLYSNDLSIVRIIFLFKELHSRSETSAFSSPLNTEYPLPKESNLREFSFQ